MDHPSGNHAGVLAPPSSRDLAHRREHTGVGNSNTKELTGETTQVLLDDSLVNGSSTTDTFTIIMSNTALHFSQEPIPEQEDLRAPPIGLALDIPQDDILNSGRHTRNLPWDFTQGQSHSRRHNPIWTLTIRLPTTPSFRQVLQDRLRLVLLDRLWHHVQNIMHDCGTKLQVIMRFHTLLGDRLRNALAVSTLELTSEQVSKPTRKT